MSLHVSLCLRMDRLNLITKLIGFYFTLSSSNVTEWCCSVWHCRVTMKVFISSLPSPTHNPIQILLSIYMHPSIYTYLSSFPAYVCIFNFIASFLLFIMLITSLSFFSCTLHSYVFISVMSSPLRILALLSPYAHQRETHFLSTKHPRQ